MMAHAGDVIIVEPEKAASPARRGVIEEVLQEQPQRLRVRWDDGHTSIFCPSAGSARIEPKEEAAPTRG